MTLPLSTPGKCCGHNLNWHNGVEGICTLCACVGFEPDMEDGMEKDRERRCRARHGQRVELQCQEMVTEATTHTCLHWAIDVDGQTVRWDSLAATYAVLVGESGPEVANPDRTQVGNGSARLGQVGGEHYRKFKIQPWDVIDEYGLSFYAGNALKYLLRAGNKGAKVEDLKKCRHYLDKLIELEEARGG